MIDLGSDWSTFFGPTQDLDPTFTTITGTKVLGEAIARRLMTPPGGLFYDPTYGFDLRAEVNAAMQPGRSFDIASRVENECLKDQRVRSCSVVVTMNLATSTMTVKISVTSDAGPFSLTLLASSLSLSLLNFG